MPPRKRKSLQAVTATPLKQMAVVGTSSSTPDLTLGELSRTQMVCQLMQKTEADLSETKEQLEAARREHATDVAQLKDELDAANAEHAEKVGQLREELEAEKDKKVGLEAEVEKKLAVVEAEQSKVLQLLKQVQTMRAEREVLWAAQTQHSARIQQLQAKETEHAGKILQLTELLRAAEAEAAQLKEKLAAEKARHAGEVTAIKTEYQTKVINAEHKNGEVIGGMLSERYDAGLRDMRDLVLILYPGQVDPLRLTPNALARSVPPDFLHPHQAPADSVTHPHDPSSSVDA